jgi:hypothetical protein
VTTIKRARQLLADLVAPGDDRFTRSKIVRFWRERALAAESALADRERERHQARHECDQTAVHAAELFKEVERLKAENERLRAERNVARKLELEASDEANRMRVDRERLRIENERLGRERDDVSQDLVDASNRENVLTDKCDAMAKVVEAGLAWQGGRALLAGRESYHPEALAFWDALDAYRAATAAPATVMRPCPQCDIRSEADPAETDLECSECGHADDAKARRDDDGKGEDCRHDPPTVTIGWDGKALSFDGQDWRGKRVEIIPDTNGVSIEHDATSVRIRLPNPEAVRAFVNLLGTCPVRPPS